METKRNVIFTNEIPYLIEDTKLVRVGVPFVRQSLAAGLVEALEGVIRVADRKTLEFDRARDALAAYHAGVGM